MDTATIAPPDPTSQEDYWQRVQALRAELGRLRPHAPHDGPPERGAGRT
jgi:hypothetical protein